MYLQHNQVDFHSKHEDELAEEEAKRQRVFDVCNARMKFQGEVEDFCQGITEVQFCKTSCHRQEECYGLFAEYCEIGGEEPKRKIIELIDLKKKSLFEAKRFDEYLKAKEQEFKIKWKNNRKGVLPEKKEGYLFE